MGPTSEARPVFVYGTLRPGQPNWERLLEGRSERVVAGRLAGVVLVDCGHYPAAVERPGAGGAAGDVVWIGEADRAEVLAALDHLEGYDPADPDRLFDRVVRSVETAQGPVECWVYVAGPMLEKEAAGPLVADGDWARHCAALPGHREYWEAVSDAGGRAPDPAGGPPVPAAPRRLVGERVVLRPPVPSDADDRLAAGFDPEVVLLQGGEPSQFTEPMAREWAQRWYERMVADDNPWAWMIEYEGRHVGSARLYDHVPLDRKASYAVALNTSALLGRGLGTEVTRLVLDFAFRPEPDGAGLHRVELRVLDFNHRGISCYRRCGFIEEGRERQAAYVDGAWRDYLVMAILETDPRSSG